MTDQAPRQKTHGSPETPYSLHGKYGMFSRYGCLLHFWQTTSKAISPTLYSLPRAIFLSSCNFSKGLAGAPPNAIARTRDTATNPAVLDAFALALAADGQGPAFPQFPGYPTGNAYPGIPGHEPSTEHARRSANLIDQCMNQLRALVPSGGA